MAVLVFSPVCNVQVRTSHAVYAMTVRSTPSPSLRGVSFTNPFTTSRELG